MRIPYYDPQQNRIRDFKPDFIFWLQKGKQYHVVFVDPHGTVHTDWLRKLEGYCSLFERRGALRTLQHEESKVTVQTLLYSREAAGVGEKYRRFWVKNVEEMLGKVGG